MSASPNNGNGFSSRFSIVLQIVTVVAVAIGGFWGAIIRPIDDKIDKLEARAISRSEHEEFKLRIDRDIVRIEGEQLRDKEDFRARFTRDVVPRSEHETERQAMTHDIATVSDRLNELRTQTTLTYTMRDEIQRLQAELSELRRQVTKGP